LRLHASRGCALVVVLWTATVAAAVTPSLAGAAGVAGASGEPATYYVAVGASESLGVQPSATDPHGRPTDQGYADDLVSLEHDRWPGLQLVQFGCSGITAEGALDGTGTCAYPHGSEVATAVDFLQRHRGRTVLATVDLGFNDVWPCLVHHAVNRACETAALARIAQALPAVVARLRAAGGRELEIVGLEHDDPYLADYLRGPAGRWFARRSIGAIDRLNDELAALYTGAGAVVADVPTAFGTADRAPAELAGHGQVPDGVARICELTWMCVAHNVHPDAAGYEVIAGAIAGAMLLAPVLGA
jgi:lysophospholipase L1-like esterase